VVKIQGLEPNPSGYCDSGVGCGCQRLTVGHCEGGVEVACPNLILASVGTSFTGSAPAGFRSHLELQGFAAHDVLLFSHLLQK